MAYSVMNYCLEITDVITTKKTQQLSVGDFIVRINDKPAIDFYDVEDYDSDSYRYHCVAKKDSKNILIESRVPIALDVKPTKQALLHRIYEDYDYDLIHQLWETGDWAMLKKAVQDHKSAVGLLTKAQLFMESRVRGKHSANGLFEGILDYHNGATRRAEKRIQAFIEKSDYMRGTDYAALAYYYMGLLTKGDAQLNFFADAAYLCRFEPQSHLAKRLSEHVELPIQQSLINHSFPADVDLANFLEKGNIQHLATLINQGTNPYTPICLMPGFRWNYYYLKLLHLHNTMLSAFADYFNPMLVLLGNDETDDKDMTDAHVLDEEAPLLEKQQIVLLKDYEHSVAQAVNVSHSPNVYLVNQDGIIVQNELEKPIDYWRLFAKLTQATVN